MTHTVLAMLVLVGGVTAQDSAPQSQPSGRDGLIAFTRGGNVWVADAGGGNERQLTRDLAYDRPIRWTSDGRNVIYWKHTGDWHLWSVDVESGAQKDLTPGGGDCRSPAVSPGGDLVAFMSGRDGLSVMNADGSNRRILSKLGHRDAPPNWSPDGARLAFVDLAPVGEKNVDPGVYLVGKDGGEAVLFIKFADEPAWSPDGRTLYCLARRKTGPDLFAIDVATKVETNLSSTAGLNENALAVSADGRRIALIAWDTDWKSCELRVLDTDGSRQKSLMKLDGRPAAPSWSPDSKRIAVSSGPETRANLFVIDADSGEARQITKEGAAGVIWQPRSARSTRSPGRRSGRRLTGR